MIHFYLSLTSILILIVPGFLLCLIITRKDTNWLEVIAASFSLSLLFSTIPGIVAYLLNFSHAQFFKLFLVLISIALIFTIIIRHKKSSLLITEKSKKDNSFTKIITLYIVFLTLFFTTLMILYKGSLTLDGMCFLSYIKKIAANSVIINQDGFYKEIIVDTSYGYNVWFLLIAFISKIANCDPIQTWIFLPILLTPLIILSFYTLAKTLFQNKRFALSSVFIFILFFGINEGCWIFRTSPYPMIVTNFLIFPIALTFAFKYFYEGKKGFLVLAGLLGLVLSTIHLWGLVVFLLSLTFFLMFHILFGIEKTLSKRILWIILVAILFSLPYILLRVPHTVIKNYYYPMVHGCKTLSKHLYYISPNSLFAPHYHTKPPFTQRGVLIFSFILAFFLFKWIKKNIWSRFLITNTFIPALIILNPVLVPIIHKIVPFFLIKRISQVIPFFLVLGLFLDKSAHSISKFFKEKTESLLNKKLKLDLFYISVLLIVLLLLSIPQKLNYRLVDFVRNTQIKGLHIWNPNFVKNPCVPVYLINPYEFMPSLRFIRNHIKKTSVILSDEEYGTFLPVFTKHFVVLAHPGLVSAAVSNQKEREKDVKIVLDFSKKIDHIISILMKYGVNYVVLNPTFSTPETTAKFRNWKNIFKEIYNRNSTIIYQVKLREKESN